MDQAVTANKPDSKGRPRVVVVVAARETAAAGAAERPATPAAGVETRRYDTPQDMGLDQPTTRIVKRRMARTAADEQLVAAVLPFDLAAVPSPLEDFLGKSLLYRAAYAAAEAGAPRLLIVGQVPQAQQAQVFDEAQRGFQAGSGDAAGKSTVELLASDPTEGELGERGRVLVLDPSALHDPESVVRLAQTRGHQTNFAVGRCGDGLMVRTREGRIVEIGPRVENADGRLVGACSVPVESFGDLFKTAERAALERLGTAEELVGILYPRTFGQQFGTTETFVRAQDLFYDRLAAANSSEGVFDGLLARPVARVFTQRFLHSPRVTPALISVVAGILALIGAFCLANTNAIPRFPGLLGIVAGLFLIGSAVLDRVDGELARLRLDEDRNARYLDFGLDHLTHMLVLVALTWVADRQGDFRKGPLRDLMNDPPPAVTIGSFAVTGVIILALVLIWRGAPRPGPQPFLTRLGDLLAGSYGSRDFFYLFLIVAVAHVILPSAGFYGVFLLLSMALVNALWLVLLIMTVLSPRAQEG
ncbi:MAG: CDP-alcohol phosphatidyltransferase family protein [Planctomycetes bacterium]|nr:CDP-alcohol phosphatidyltransferase family protein [Planctomycetota bacterium]